MSRADTTWMRAAACASPPHRGLPWLDDTRTVPPVLVDVMGDVCGGCPVLATCAGYTAAAGVTGGFWAGADRDLLRPARLVVQLDLIDLLERNDLLESDDLGGAA
jgi:hypothetical protein